MNDKPRFINCGGKLLDLSQAKVMGILNITPDSFYAGSRLQSGSDIVTAAVKMTEEGAAILDVGGYSSRPGAEVVPEEEEAERCFTAIRLILKELPGAVISIDTFRAKIAREAVLGCGAMIINDISGGELDNRMFSVVKELNVPYILMHMRGTPATMQTLTDYNDIVTDILKWFAPKIHELQSAGVKDIILDPGFGFAKTIAQNFEMLRRFNDFSVAGLPLLAGLSRKATIWKTLGTTPSESLNGTTVLNTIALLKGADILRVHDVRQAVEAIRLTGAVVS